MRERKAVHLIIAIIILAPAIIVDSSGQEDEKLILWVEVNDFIGSGTVDHVSLAIEEATDRKFVAVVLAIDTFGGLVDSMFNIVDSIQRSPIPVIGFVYPSGEQALSAGTYILMSTDLAVMAPFTKIGSAQPISGGTPINDTKTINALVKEMEGFAAIHGRNKTQLTRFITHNDNLLAEEALRTGVIELVASTKEDLIEKADGLTVKTINGEKSLDLEGASFVTFQEVPRVKIVKVFSDPLVSSLLVSIGILVLILGLSAPGFGAEIGGAMLLIFGLIGQGFNVNYAALAIMGIGAALLIFELYTPSFGIIGIGGILTLGVGSIFFVTRPPDPILISPGAFNAFVQTVIGAVVISGVIFGVLIYKFVQVRRIKNVLNRYPTGDGKAVDNIASDGEGYIVVNGEYWKATSKEKIKAGDKVNVVRPLRGLLLVELWKSENEETQS